MTISHWGIVGAFVGIVLAAAEYLVFGALAAKMLGARLAGMDPLQRQQSGRTLRIIRTVLAVQLAIFPVVGYGIGSLIEAGSGAH